MNYVSPFDEERRVAEPLAPRRQQIERRLQAAGAQTFRLTKQIFSKPAGPDIIRTVAGRGDLAVEALAD